MSRTKKALIVAAVMIVAGVITVISAFAVNGFRWPNLTVNLAHMTSEPINYTKKTVNLEADFRKIDIESSPDIDVAIKKASGNTSYVEYYDCNNLTQHVDVSDGTLKITADDSRNSKYNISIGIYTGAWPSVTVYLAGTEYEELSIVTGSGDVDAEYYLEIKKIDIESSSGDVYVKGANTDTLTIETSSGNISLDSVVAKGANLSANSGDISIDDVIAQDGINVKTTSGDITSDKIKADHISCNASSGDITFDKSDALGYDIVTSSGDVYIKVSSDKKYEYTTKTSSGDVDVPGSADSADGKCSIRTNSGDIIVED